MGLLQFKTVNQLGLTMRNFFSHSSKDHKWPWVAGESSSNSVHWLLRNKTFFQFHRN